MATEIEGITMARPMTHDLLKTLLGEVGCSVQSIEITELKENTYYAAINLTLAGGRQLMLDSRPSDAIALALRAKCPIYVAKAVLEASSVLQQDESKELPVENVSNVSQEKWGEILEKMTPDDFKYKQ